MTLLLIAATFIFLSGWILGVSYGRSTAKPLVVADQWKRVWRAELEQSR